MAEARNRSRRERTRNSSTSPAGEEKVVVFRRYQLDERENDPSVRGRTEPLSPIQELAESDIYQLCFAADAWDVLAAARAVIDIVRSMTRPAPRLSPKRETLHPWLGKSFAELPNPFAPLVGIWKLGFAFEGMTDTTIVLAVARPDRVGSDPTRG